MFPEFRELINQLRSTDRHFSHLFDKHNRLDEQIQRMEARSMQATDAEIETLKKEKLLMKDQLYSMLKKAST